VTHLKPDVVRPPFCEPQYHFAKLPQLEFDM